MIWETRCALLWMKAENSCPEESPDFSSVLPLSLFSWFLGEWPAHTWAKRRKLYLMLVLVLLPPAFTGETAVPQERHLIVS